MASASNAKIQIESGQSLVSWESLADAGDHRIFNPTAAILSGVTPPEVRPDGVVTGVYLLSPGTDADKVNVAAFSAYSGGVLHNVSAATVSISRPATAVAKVCSITMDSSGDLAVEAGTDGSDADFVETRGAAGGPPLIPAGSIELGQVRVTASTPALITAAQILQNGQYTERADFPVFTVNNIGKGLSAKTAGETNAYVQFNEALPLSHGTGQTKGVYCQYYIPSFADIAKSQNFVPAETSHSISSTSYYGGATASSSESLGQASFTALLESGVSDFLVAQKNKTVTVKFFPNRNASGHIVTQGKLGIGRSFPVDDQIQAACTITAEVASAEFSS
ncbi:MAG: hypothetical protein GX570_02450 [Corynebacterium marinum]|uniref:Uncharacterized protein n=1 Tax=Corynebacterium marinum TaxID=349751 RepID=A0A847H9U1_9CORY|nr:hypothetical protein [Corynebacterium marinum]